LTFSVLLSIGATSVINIKIITEGQDAVQSYVLATKTIPIDTLPFDAQGMFVVIIYGASFICSVFGSYLRYRVIRQGMWPACG